MNTVAPTQVLAELRRHYACLEALPASESTRVSLAALDVGPGAVLFEEGGTCAGFPLVLEGTVSVARRSPAGRTLELYRVGPGEICVVSAASLYRTCPLGARGVTLTPTRLVLIPPAAFSAWSSYAPFRDFVFGVFAQRLSDLMALVDAVAFQKLDQRLADHLLGHGGTLRTTHQALADELGTVREIVTRVLRRFEEAGLVRLGRERIEVLDAPGLRAQANGQTAGHGSGRPDEA